MDPNGFVDNYFLSSTGIFTSGYAALPFSERWAGDVEVYDLRVNHEEPWVIHESVRGAPSQMVCWLLEILWAVLIHWVNQIIWLEVVNVQQGQPGEIPGVLIDFD
jgi:hypothetical protein